MENERHHTSLSDEESADAPSGEIKPRRWWIAAVLSASIPGLGQVYNGQVGKGVAITLLLLLLTESMVVGVLVSRSILSFWIALGLAAVVWVASPVEAAWTARSQVSYRLRRVNRVGAYVAYSLAVMLAQSLVSSYLRAHWMQAFRIPAESMKPTLLMGDFIVADKRGTREPRRGDVIVLEYPPDRTKLLVKRVVGIAGDRIEIRNKTVVLNRHVLAEPYATHEDPMIRRAAFDTRDNAGPLIVPSRAMFVMGDNRDNSNDSRYWGPCPVDAVVGKPFMIYWSWDADSGRVRWQRIGRKMQ